MLCCLLCVHVHESLMYMHAKRATQHKAVSCCLMMRQHENRGRSKGVKLWQSICLYDSCTCISAKKYHILTLLLFQRIFGVCETWSLPFFFLGSWIYDNMQAKMFPNLPRDEQTPVEFSWCGQRNVSRSRTARPLAWCPTSRRPVSVPLLPSPAASLGSTSQCV